MKHKGNNQKAWKIIILGIVILVAIILGMIGLNKQETCASKQETCANNQTCENNQPNDIQVCFNRFHTVLTMFFMNYDEKDTNGLVIIAKYLAFFVAASAVFAIIKGIFGSVKWYIKGKNPQNTLVVGENRYAEALLCKLGKRGIGNEWKDLKTRGKVVLMGTDEENLQYLQEHNWLKKRSDDASVRVFMRSSKINGVLSQNGNIAFFSLEEIAARKYWKQHRVENPDDETFYEKKDVTISIIGEGELLEELLLFGTQMNIYGKDYHIYYQIFGDNQEFEKTHRHHDQLGFVFFQGKWWQDADRINALRQSDRVIILDQKNSYQVFNHLLLAAPEIKEIHIFADEVFDDSKYAEIWKNIVKDDRGFKYQGKLVPFNWIQECCSEDLISDDIVFDAIGCNEVYNVRYDANYEWNQLSTYHKYSNIMASDFAILYQGLLFDGPVPSKETSRLEYLPKYGALEHARWRNYNYYFNWDVYENPPTLEAKDNQRRLHADLVPNEGLSQEVKMKDLNAVFWLLIRAEMPEDVTKLRAAIKAKLESMQELENKIKAKFEGKPELEEEKKAELDSMEGNTENT